MPSHPTEFNLQVTARDHETELALRGELDAYTGLLVREALVDVLAARPARLVIDMADVEFMDSTGMSVLIVGLKRARSQGTDFALRQVQSRVLRVLEMTGLTKVFEIA